MLAMLAILVMGEKVYTAPAAQGPDAHAMQLEMQDARVAPVPAGGSASVRAVMYNPTSITLVLVGAISPLAGQTTLQRHAVDKSGIDQIVPVNRLAIPPHGEVVLAPGALELQLVGATQDYQEGLDIPLTLKFEDGTRRWVRVKVEGE